MNAPGKLLSSVGLAVALAGGTTTLFLVAHGSSGSPLSGGAIAFSFWVASPFLVLGGLNLYCLREPVPYALRLAAAITSGAVALSVFLYADAVFNPHGSTEALIFIFLPLWSLLGGAVVLLILFWGVLWYQEHPKSGT